MKILYCITKSNFGGAQRYVYDLATSLSKQNEGQNEGVVALGGHGQLAEKLEAIGIRTISIPKAERDVSFLKDLGVFFSLIKIIRAEKPDVLHINSSKIGGLGALAGRFCRVPQIIFTAHGWAFKEPRGTFATLIIKILSWLTIIFSHSVIVLSEKERAMVAKWPGAAKKLHVIPLGIRALPTLSKEEALQELGIKVDEKMAKKKIVGTIAELNHNKGLPYAVQGLAEYIKNDLLYVIIGEGEKRAELEKLITDTKTGDRIFLAGYKKDAARLLPAFDIFLLPSVKEGLPYVILEAGAASLPVIATKVGGIPEVIENLVSGLLVAPARPNEIRNALLYLDDHPEMFASLGANLKEKIAKDFSLEKMIEGTFNLYNKM
ncbi:MAG: glycosyltransferase [Candidatus Pacebacteria bacterium]|nr:glycosyltransferase [Candidatus Paceibacterota bacterium]